MNNTSREQMRQAIEDYRRADAEYLKLIDQIMSYEGEEEKPFAKADDLSRIREAHEKRDEAEKRMMNILLYSN